MQVRSPIKRGLVAVAMAAIGATLAAGGVLAADSTASRPQAPAASSGLRDSAGAQNFLICPEGSARVCTRAGCFCT